MTQRSTKRLTLCGLVLVLMLVVATTACQRVQYRSTLPPSGQIYTHWNSFFLLGLIGDALILPNRLCPQGVYSVDVYHSFGNILLTGLTLGLYSPTTADIHCAALGSRVGSRDSRVVPVGTDKPASRARQPTPTVHPMSHTTSAHPPQPTLDTEAQ